MLALALVLLSAGPVGDASFMRGMTVSCPGYGEIWGSEKMTESLRDLRAIGVEWVSIHPYAAVRGDGSLRVHAAAETGYLKRAVEIAKAEKVQLFWKPHLAYWGSFSWRGAIEFRTEAAWQKFFSAYEVWIVDQAKFAEAAKVPLFSVGIEYERTVHREAAWRKIIRAVRKVYTGKITYSANWDGIARVPFWDAVDLIGVQAYFPVSSSEDPSVDRKVLAASWDRHLEQLRALSKKHGKRVLFTEIGYARSKVAATRPWEPRVDSADVYVGLRKRLMEVALTRVEREPCIAGMFWWKWIPGNTRSDGDFSMKDPEARAALSRHWLR